MALNNGQKINDTGIPTTSNKINGNTVFFHRYRSLGDLVACFKEATRGRNKPCPPNLCSVQSLSHVWLCDPMDYSTPGFPVHHRFLELTQTHVHPVGDAIQPSYPLSSPSSAFSLSQHQGLFQWVSSLHQVTKVLELQHQSFQSIFRTDLLQNGLVWSPSSPRDSQEPSPTPQFKSSNSLALSLLYGPALTSIHEHWNYCIQNRWPTRTSCIAQGTILSIL